MLEACLATNGAVDGATVGLVQMDKLRVAVRTLIEMVLLLLFFI